MRDDYLRTVSNLMRLLVGARTQEERDVASVLAVLWLARLDELWGKVSRKSELPSPQHVRALLELTVPNLRTVGEGARAPRRAFLSPLGLAAA